MFYNMSYILCNWKLGFWEIGAKIFVFQEVYETLLYLLAPFVLPISLIVKPAFCAYLMLGTLGLYYLNVTVSPHIAKRPAHSLQDTNHRIRSSTKSTSAAETNASSGKSSTSTTRPTRSS
jgi:hypothetical protein